jgi:hypothetical protein
MITKMPIRKWSGSSKELFSFENDTLTLNFNVAEEYEEILLNWTKEICDYRIHYHFERKAGNPQVH